MAIYVGSPASAQTLAVFQRTEQNNYPYILLSLHDIPSALGILGHVMQYFMYIVEIFSTVDINTD